MKTLSIKARTALVAIIVIACVGCDQATKYIAVEKIKPAGRIEVAGPLFAFQYAENEGAFLSLGATMSKPARFWIFTVFTSFVLVALAYYVFMGAGLLLPDIVAIALLLAGGIGNMIDRVANNGIVVDFMVMEVWGPIRTGVFNIADVAVMAGVFLMLGSRFFIRHGHHGDTTHDAPHA
ncbi:MAG: signal peptidase II [Candidatus Hydrogenedentes bacterium]|nr:signal peptidase II [Candidatus Hydrogenedentota bacterium]